MCMLKVYPEIIKSLINFGLSKELEWAKAIRKKWAAGRIHPDLYLDIKEATYKAVGVDIDELKDFDTI